MWRAWQLDAATWGIIAGVVWLAGWEAAALARHDYDGTITAHLRPLFLSWPITWWLAFGLWAWLGLHMLAPALEAWIAEAVRGAVTR